MILIMFGASGCSNKVITLFLVLLILAGCSNRAVYGGIQTSNRIECLELPPSQYDECMEDANRSYDEYEREREKDLGQ
jgi:uncharacterized lipoprotein NlpE involved in copper resistance